MLLALIVMLAQGSMRATQPGYFLPVVLGLLIAGGVGWLIAAVLGFARARAFGSSARWFTYAAVCLIIYHVQFLLLGIIMVLNVTQNDTDFGMVLSVGAFFNLFVLIGAFCAIMGFIRLTSPR